MIDRARIPRARAVEPGEHSRSEPVKGTPARQGAERDLRLLPDQVQLVASAFLITYAGLLLVGGRCADRWSRLRVFLLGVAVFGAVSLGAAPAEDAARLDIARLTM